MSRAIRSRRYLQLKMDAEVRRLALQRDGFKCVTCGTTEKLTASHYVKRDAHATRWLLYNVWTQCSSCNSRHSHCPEMLRRHIVKAMGEETLALLEREYLSSKPMTDRELRGLYDALWRM